MAGNHVEDRVESCLEFPFFLSCEWPCEWPGECLAKRANDLANGLANGLAKRTEGKQGKGQSTSFSRARGW
jgi:hypothetical protein